MPVTISAAYFSTGVFAGAAPGELFQSSTCLACGTRFKTFAAFRAHRKAVALAPCKSLEDEHPDTQPAWALGLMSGPDRAALDALVQQLPDPDLDGPLATLVDLHA